VIRGDDHVNNTPRQINLYRALGAAIPLFGHVPMILGSDGQRLSKRHGAVSVMQYKDDGFLPDAMVNYLARLGWSHGDEEIFSREQLIEWFDLAHVSKSPARWDPEKLRWLNAEYLRRWSDTEIAMHLHDEKPGVYRFLESVMDPIAMTAVGRAKIQTLLDHEQFLMAMAQPPHLEPALAEQHLGEAGRRVVGELVPKLRALPAWDAPSIAAVLKETVKAMGVKPPAVMMPFRVALTHQAQTPAIDAIAAALRKDVALGRLEQAASR
jgi:glutamyl-tRNA synthetase